MLEKLGAEEIGQGALGGVGDRGARRELGGQPGRTHVVGIELGGQFGEESYT